MVILMGDIRQWLESLELDQYTDAFEENAIAWNHLPDLDHDILKEIGVAVIGHRMTILKAVDDLALVRSPQKGKPGDTVLTKIPLSDEAERRQLTVMFCDLVGSTALSVQMDPEDYRDVLAAYQSAVSNSIKMYEGFVARYMGDGLLVYFGYPQAHEDDPERAVRAGIDIVDVVGALRLPVDIDLKVRIGIATGLVVAGDIVGEGVSEERAVLGDTPNLAARLQSIAKPNTVVLSDATRRLVERRIDLQTLEPRPLKGLEGMVPAYRAVSVREGSRFDIANSSGLTTMAGRTRELDLLKRCWRRARGGSGRTLLLSGEAGIGKSRLIQELIMGIDTQLVTVQHHQCSPYHTDSAFHPVVENLHRAAGFLYGDSTSLRLEKLEALVQYSLAGAEGVVPLLAALSSLPIDAYPPLEMTPQRQKAATIDVLIKFLEQQADRGPVLKIFEDAHWMDRSTQELLGLTIDRIPMLPVLCLITHRPDFSPPWKDNTRVSTCTLTRLGREEVGRIVERLTGGKALPAEVLHQIADKTDGVPLFVEELTKTVLEKGVLEEVNGRYTLSDPSHALSIPSTLHDSLMARLDRLTKVKEIAQIAACIGREFSSDLLAEIIPLERDLLETSLAQLVAAELVLRRDMEDNNPSFVFKHALMQDVAYESLLMKKRRQVHARIASVLTERLQETANTEPERLAHHYTAAGMAKDAIPHWLAAGRRSLAGASYPEAISHLSKALELVADIDEADERQVYEIEVRTILGSATTALHGWPAIEVRDVVGPACDIFEQGHGHSDSFLNFWNLWTHHACRAEHREGLIVIERMLKHSHERADPVLEMVATFTAAMAHLWVGDYNSAQMYESRALELYDLERDHDLALSYNHDPKNTLLSWGSHRTWALGCTDEACALADAAVDHARRVGHAFNLCWTLGNSSITSSNCGKYGEARERIEELRDVARAQDLVFMEAYMVPVGMCAIHTGEGNHEKAYNEASRSEEIWRSIGGRFYSPVVYTLMAQACLNLGRAVEAVGLMDKAIAQMVATGEMMHAAEIYHVSGLAQLKHSGDELRAEEHFRKSLHHARQQGTRSFELRTSLSLAGLWHEQGSYKQALDLLVPICNWFPVRPDSEELKNARALLSELSELSAEE